MFDRIPSKFLSKYYRRYPQTRPMYKVGVYLHPGTQEARRAALLRGAEVLTKGPALTGLVREFPKIGDPNIVRKIEGSLL